MTRHVTIMVRLWDMHKKKAQICKMLGPPDKGTAIKCLLTKGKRAKI